MMLLPSSLLLFISLVVPATAEGGACKAPAPIALPIGNVSVTDTGVTRWGLKAQFGSPPQTACPSISPDWNQTSLWSPILVCGKWARPRCAWHRGGDLDPVTSETFEKNEQKNVYEFRPKDGTKRGISPWGTDKFTVNSDVVLEDFPIWSKSVGIVNQNALGLGRNSTFLNILQQQKHIASQTWSLFWGWQGRHKNQQMEGSFVAGGYDKAKVEGQPNMTMDFSDDIECASSLLISLSDITVNHANGEKTQLLGGGGKGMQSCITPDLPLVTLPKSAHDKFVKSLPGKQYGPSKGMYFNGINTDPKNAFAGNITFTTASGLHVTIPNHQLVLPNIDIDDRTGDHYQKDDNQTIMVFHEPVKEMPILGQVFLSSAYLHVDNHEKKFTLWQAKPKSKMQLVTVDHSEGDKNECEGEETQSPSTDGSTQEEDISADSEDGDGKHKSGSSLSGGAIAGIVIGVVAGVALIAAALWFFLVRRKRQQNAQAWGSHAANSGAEKVRPPEDALENNADTTDMKVFVGATEELDGGEGHKTLPEMSVREGSAMELPGDMTFPDQTPNHSETTPSSEQTWPRHDSGNGRNANMSSPEPMSATGLEGTWDSSFTNDSVVSPTSPPPR